MSYLPIAACDGLLEIIRKLNIPEKSYLAPIYYVYYPPLADREPSLSDDRAVLTIWRASETGHDILADLIVREDRISYYSQLGSASGSESAGPLWLEIVTSSSMYRRPTIEYQYNSPTLFEDIEARIIQDLKKAKEINGTAATDQEDRVGEPPVL